MSYELTNSTLASSMISRPKASYLLTRLILILAFLIAPMWASAAIHEVQVLDPRSFSPSTLTIQVGDTVRWINASGGLNHDVTADDGSFNSMISSSFVFEMTFNTPGDILYHCTVHSRSAASGGTAQNGTITVMAASTSPDIGVSSVDVVNGDYQVGDSVEVTAQLNNSGDGDSGMFSVTFRATSDDDPASPIDLGTVAVPNIAAGASMGIGANFELPASMATGFWTVEAVSSLADSNSGNNSDADAIAIFVFTEFIINAGLNDAWFNQITDGQGFFITVFPELNFILLAWFTYDTELPPDGAVANLGDPGHRWLTAVGSIEGSMAVLTIEIASGGLFDTGGGVTRVEDGTITLQFDNCNEGSATYSIPSIGAEGVVPIERVATDNVSLCRSLLTELTQP